MNYQKVRKVRSPERGTPKSAGIDFFIPEFQKEDLMRGELKIGDSILIPSGIKMKIPPGYVLIALNKSSVATRLGCVIGAQVIDEDYQGEIHINLIKVTGEPIWLGSNQKIAQFLMLPVNYAELHEVPSQATLFDNITERGEGGFGSTDK